MWRGRLSPSSHPRRPAPPFFNHGVASRHSLPGEDAALIVFPKQQCGQMCCFPTGRRSTGAGFRRVRLVRCTTLFGLAEISCGLSCSVFTKVVGHWLRRVRKRVPLGPLPFRLRDSSRSTVSRRPSPPPLLCEDSADILGEGATRRRKSWCWPQPVSRASTLSQCARVVVSAGRSGASGRAPLLRR